MKNLAHKCALLIPWQQGCTIPTPEVGEGWNLSQQCRKAMPLDPKSCVFGGAISQKERAPLQLFHPTPRRHANPDEAAVLDAVSNTPTAVDGVVVLLRSRILGLKLIV